jgi:hypothetical protein
MNNLTRHQTFNNMHFMYLNVLSDFMKVLNSIRKHSTKNEYFHKHTLFTTIYLLQEQRLNPRTYFEKEINMDNFIQATENDTNMHENFQYLNMHGCL